MSFHVQLFRQDIQWHFNLPLIIEMQIQSLVQTPFFDAKWSSKG